MKIIIITGTDFSLFNIVCFNILQHVVVCGSSITLIHIGPYLQIPMTHRVRLFTTALVNVIVCIIETIQTIVSFKKVASCNFLSF